jgi:small-conductance mechanosensitive channel
VVVRVVVVRFLRSAATHRNFSYAQPVIEAVKNKILFWSLLGGLAIALEYVNEAVAWRRHVDVGLFIVFVFTAASTISRIITGAMRAHAQETHNATWSASIARRVVQVTALSIALLLTASALGMQITAVLTVFGIGGAAFALSLQDTLGNVFAGASISLGKQIRVGDYIMLGTTVEGTLADIGWRNSTVVMHDHTCVIVPNRDVANGHVRRMTGSASTLTLQVWLDVARSVEPDVAVTTILEAIAPVAAQETVLVAPTGEHVVTLRAEPTPTVRLTKLTEQHGTYVVTVAVSSLVHHAASRDVVLMTLYTALHDRLPILRLAPTVS